MSKSYGKYKTIGCCWGSNTEYYRDRNRRLRNKDRQNIRNLLANKPIEEFDDVFIPTKEPDNMYWNEPTDGTFKLYHIDFIKYKSKYRYHGIYPTKKNRIKK